MAPPVIGSDGPEAGCRKRRAIMIRRYVFKTKALICSFCALALLQPAQARSGGAVFVVPSVGVGLYDLYWAYPTLYGGTAGGTVKFDTERKDAAVYVDGGYAGTVGKVKSLHLQPGPY